LMVLTRLQSLNLAWNDLGPAGASSLAPSLMVLTGLQSLNLSGNDLGPDGMLSLAPSLTVLTELQNLDLLGNDLGLAERETLSEGSLKPVPSYCIIRW